MKYLWKMSEVEFVAAAWNSIIFFTFPVKSKTNLSPKTEVNLNIQKGIFKIQYMDFALLLLWSYCDFKYSSLLLSYFATTSSADSRLKVLNNEEVYWLLFLPAVAISFYIKIKIKKIDRILKLYAFFQEYNIIANEKLYSKGQYNTKVIW